MFQRCQTFYDPASCFVCRWYHGVLDRRTAEERLNRFNKRGAYLVRESERKAGSYSLSFLGINGFSHFRITSILGHYYIGGRQFASLSNLIGYYTSESRLLENEYLAHPVPPLEVRPTFVSRGYRRFEIFQEAVAGAGGLTRREFCYLLCE